MKENEKSNKIIITSIFVVFSLLSIFVISPWVSNPKFHSKTIETLDNKKMQVAGWTTGTVGAATVLALVPGDATTPLANQILQISSYFFIVIGALFLEKILLTLTGYIAFTFLIPISCLLFIIYLFYNNDALKRIAIRLTVFGLAIFLVVPTSIKISNVIESTYKTTINQSIEEVESTSKSATKESEGLGGITSKIQEGISSIGTGVSKVIKKGEKMLSDLIDTLAVSIITTCIIPILVFLCFGWIIKIIFNLNLSSIKYNNIIKQINKNNNKKLYNILGNDNNG